MKKYLALTSVLALAACGGGGGHSGVAPRAAVTPEALTSNGYITSMASEVLVPKGSGAIVTRSGTVNLDGVSYTSYRLDDVDFRIATGGGSDALMNFHMDSQGKIDSLTAEVGAEKQKLFRRNDTSSDFRGVVYEYIVLEGPAGYDNDYSKSDEDTLVRLVYSAEGDPTSYSVLEKAAKGKCPAGKSCRWDRIDQAFRVTSKGGTDDLTYSDFGMLQTSNFGKYKGVTAETFAEAKDHTRDKDGVVGTAKTWDNIDFDTQDYDVFGGGYKVSALEHRPTTDMHFTGKAIGSVYATRSSDHHHGSVALEDNAATLDFVGGVETLAMHFDNWYDVTVTKNGDTNHISFTDFDGDDSATGNAFRTAGSREVDNFTTTTGDFDADGHVKREGLLDMGYYGATGPEEATGVVRFKETTNEGGVRYEREFRAGYGMK